MLFSPIFSNYKIQKTGIVLYPCSLAFLLFVFVIEQIIECIGAEGLQSSYRGMCSEDAIDNMEEASEKLDEVIELLGDIV